MFDHHDDHNLVRPDRFDQHRLSPPPPPYSIRYHHHLYFFIFCLKSYSSPYCVYSIRREKNKKNEKRRYGGISSPLQPSEQQRVCPSVRPSFNSYQCLTTTTTSRNCINLVVCKHNKKKIIIIETKFSYSILSGWLNM